jgi:transcriptional regulator with XRE-family HTH domain
MALAAKAGIAQSYLSDLERGIEENPSREVIRAIAKALQVSAKELAGAAWPDETTVREPLPLGSIPEPLARALQSVGSLLDNTGS